MQTHFTETQLKDPQIKRTNDILRSCIHCGFCTATCPTYQVLGDELDSPRGRIYLIKDMLENQRIPDEKTVKHVDRCLSCLACLQPFDGLGADNALLGVEVVRGGQQGRTAVAAGGELHRLGGAERFFLPVD